MSMRNALLPFLGVVAACSLTEEPPGPRESDESERMYFDDAAIPRLRGMTAQEARGLLAARRANDESIGEAITWTLPCRDGRSRLGC
jgi:hypothetical protein